jgi:hypothetical protein
MRMAGMAPITIFFRLIFFISPSPFLRPHIPPRVFLRPAKVFAVQSFSTAVVVMVVVIVRAVVVRTVVIRLSVIIAAGIRLDHAAC